VVNRRKRRWGVLSIIILPRSLSPGYILFLSFFAHPSTRVPLSWGNFRSRGLKKKDSVPHLPIFCRSSELRHHSVQNIVPYSRSWIWPSSTPPPQPDWLIHTLARREEGQTNLNRRKGQKRNKTPKQVSRYHLALGKSVNLPCFFYPSLSLLSLPCPTQALAQPR